MKTAFLFPGQGAQEVGMGRDLLSTCPLFKSLLELGSELTHEDLERLCSRGPERKLRQSFFLQPIMVSVSLGYASLLRDEGIESDVVLGHSLGEITALATSGVVSDEMAVRIAAKRGELMDHAASIEKGGMAAVLSVPMETLQEVLAAVDDPSGVVIANDNAPGQIVISGREQQLKQISEQIRERHLGRCRSLSVSGPWHGPWMESARHEFEAWIESIEFLPPKRPLVLNATGAQEDAPQRIKELITRQLTSPVLWRQCMAELKRVGVDTLLEIGPGRVLSGLARLNGFGAESRAFNISSRRGIQSFLGACVGTTSGDLEVTG
ncbi:MAG: ACP S-malonyltransferase [Verrucomicrobia bacterium]|jgi:[acyl-carrier-protein] S-malonyltransferase|nr:ACP S-malonyltransferase [Verrucomicrobiota bacterium]